MNELLFETNIMNINEIITIAGRAIVIISIYVESSPTFKKILRANRCPRSLWLIRIERSDLQRELRSVPSLVPHLTLLPHDTRPEVFK